MLTFLAPLYLYAAVAVAAGVAAAHFIVTRPPRSSVLPTVRFVPESTVRVVTFERPRDLLLLLLRALTVLLIGLAFAGPIWVDERRPVARIVVADVSRSVGAIEEVRDRVGELLDERDLLIVYDGEARVVGRGAADTVSVLERSARRGRLSAALVAAVRAAPQLRDEADSVEIAIVSPFRAEQIDAATEAIRSLWPGRIRLVPVEADPGADAPPVGVSVRAEAEDGVALAAQLAGLLHSPGGAAGREMGEPVVRIVRGEATAEDSAWAAAGNHTLVRWPAESAPPGWRERARPDTAGAVVAGATALVYPLERWWEPGPASPVAGVEARVIARWVDGEPSAVERRTGAGCIRDVAIPVPERGDLVLRPTFTRLVEALGAPCRTEVEGHALSEEELGALAGEGPLAAREEIRPEEVVRSRWTPWLLAAALTLLLVEVWARRGGAHRGGAERRGGAGSEGVGEVAR